MKFRNCVFSDNCTVTFADGTEEKDCLGFVRDNKRVYQTKEGVELTGTKKPASIKLLSIVVNPMEIGIVNALEAKE